MQPEYPARNKPGSSSQNSNHAWVMCWPSICHLFIFKLLASQQVLSNIKSWLSSSPKLLKIQILISGLCLRQRFFETSSRRHLSCNDKTQQRNQFCPNSRRYWRCRLKPRWQKQCCHYSNANPDNRCRNRRSWIYGDNMQFSRINFSKIWFELFVKLECWLAWGGGGGNAEWSRIRPQISPNHQHRWGWRPLHVGWRMDGHLRQGLRLHTLLGNG